MDGDQGAIRRDGIGGFRLAQVLARRFLPVERALLRFRLLLERDVAISRRVADRDALHAGPADHKFFARISAGRMD